MTEFLWGRGDSCQKPFWSLQSISDVFDLAFLDVFSVGKCSPSIGIDIQWVLIYDDSFDFV